MKLLVKTTLFYLLISLIVFGVGGAITYDIFTQQIDLELDRYLRQKLWETSSHIEEGTSYKKLVDRNLKIEILGPEAQVYKRPHLQDTLVYHNYLKRLEPNRKATWVKEINDTIYKLSVYDVIIEEDDISRSVYSALTKMFGLLAVFVVLFSVIFSQYLFKPFNQTLRKIKAFRIKDPQPLSFPKAHTQEFATLNAFISQMTTKAQDDYLNLKEFTENASHEMQTPLAIAKGKIELLLQSENLDDNQVLLIASTHRAIDKLSKIGQSLALLSKIGNREFADLQDLNVGELMEEMLEGFKELIDLKRISLRTEIEANTLVKMDPVLGDILLTNILQNAIRHNFEGGIIEVFVDPRGISVKNTGDPPSYPTDQLFERFKKDNQSGESTGLGLSIVKKICEVNDWEVDYHYDENWHELRLMFPTF